MNYSKVIKMIFPYTNLLIHEQVDIYARTTKLLSTRLLSKAPFFDKLPYVNLGHAKLLYSIPKRIGRQYLVRMGRHDSRHFRTMISYELCCKLIVSTVVKWERIGY